MFVQQKQLGTSSTGPAIAPGYPRQVAPDSSFLILTQRKQATYTSSKRPVLEIPQHAVAPEQGYPKDIHKGFPDIPERKALDLTMMVLTM